MTLSLDPELQKFIDEQIKAGHFSSPEEVIEAGLSSLMMQEPELDDATIAAIDEAEAQHERGEGIPLDEAFDRLRKKYSGK